MASRVKRRRYSRGRKRTTSKRSKYSKKKVVRYKKYSKYGKHKKVSRQRIQSLLPDVALSKLKFFCTGVGLDCTDLGTNLVNTAGAPNFLKVHLNCNPKGGLIIEHAGTNLNGNFNPVDTYVTKYRKYRCHGVSAKITVITQDNGLVSPVGSVSNTQIATPVLLTGFPYQSDDATLANYWLDSVSGGYTANTIPSMKYGFKRLSPGLGGKSMITYKTYWSIPKIFGHTDTQWMADERYCCDISTIIKPALEACMLLNLSDFTTAVTRVTSVTVQLTQYGRWEGQLADTF